MALSFPVVDAFTSAPFRGNPACVVLLGPDQPASGQFLQDFAREMNLSETAYLRKVTDGRYHIRWFTPTVEVDLCGHATLASAHFLFHGPEQALDSIELTCNFGVLRVQKSPEGITLDFPAEPPRPMEKVPSNLAAALGLAESEVVTVEANRFDLFIQARVVVVTARGNTRDIVSRTFGPSCGVNEDPLCGSAHCGLACFWSQRLNKTTITACQMTLSFTVVDAFTSAPFRGNPACVVLLGPEQQASDQFMQDFAKEMNLSETAYLRKVTDGRYHIRWFTPAVEVDLCGHATLASAHFLFHGPEQALDSIELTCKVGVLRLRKSPEGITLDFPAEHTKPLEGVPSNVAAALGVAESEIVTVEANRMDYLIQDPVTGSAHCGLACFWSGRLNKTTMTAYQASARGGELVMTLKGDRVLMVGQSVAVTKGEYLGNVY